MAAVSACKEPSEAGSAATPAGNSCRLQCPSLNWVCEKYSNPFSMAGSVSCPPAESPMARPPCTAPRRKGVHRLVNLAADDDLAAAAADAADARSAAGEDLIQLSVASAAAAAERPTAAAT